MVRAARASRGSSPQASGDSGRRRRQLGYSSTVPGRFGWSSISEDVLDLQRRRGGSGTRARKRSIAATSAPPSRRVELPDLPGAIARARAAVSASMAPSAARAVDVARRPPAREGRQVVGAEGGERALGLVLRRAERMPVQVELEHRDAGSRAGPEASRSAWSPSGMLPRSSPTMVAPARARLDPRDGEQRVLRHGDVGAGQPRLAAPRRRGRSRGCGRSAAASRSGTAGAASRPAAGSPPR